MAESITYLVRERVHVGGEAILFCNAVGRYGKTWFPMWVSDLGFTDMGGIRVKSPDEWRLMTSTEIDAVMLDQDTVPDVW